MLGNLDRDRPVKIIGAGIAGLTLAYRLKQLDRPFTLIEKKHIGGKIITRPTEFGPVESAASTLYLNKAVVAFLQELKLSPLYPPKGLKKTIWNGKTPGPAFSLPLALRVLSRLGSSVPQITKESNVEDVFLPLLGKKYIDKLLSPSLQGVYLAEAKDLHFHSLFPFVENLKISNYWSLLRGINAKIKNQNDKKLKGSVTFDGGMKTLIERLRSEVKEHIHVGEAEVFPEDNLALCTNAREAAELVSFQNPQISFELRRIKYLPVSSFTFFTQGPIPELNAAFGMLIPSRFKNTVLGIISQSNLFPTNYPKAHCYRAILKGERPDEKAIIAELIKLTKGLKKKDILETHLTSWSEGLPLFDKERFEAIQNIKKSLQNEKGLLLFGNYTQGISMRSIIEQAYSFHG